MGEPEVLLPAQQPHPAEPRTAQQSAARRDPPPRQLLPVTFAAPTEANIEQLRVLNLAIFPISYQDRVYKDILACGDVTQLAYNNNVLVGAVGCRLERRPEVRGGGLGLGCVCHTGTVLAPAPLPWVASPLARAPGCQGACAFDSLAGPAALWRWHVRAGGS